MRRFRIFSVWNIVFLMAIVVLFLLVVYPMGSIFQASLLSAETSEFTWDNYLSVFTTKFYRRCLWNSFFLSALATVFSVIIGVPFAFLTTRYKLPHASLLKTLGTLPLILPTFIGAEAWLLLLGRNGILTQFFHSIGLNTPSIYGWQGVVLVYTLQFFPFVFLMVSAAINSVDRSLEESARNLGASPWRVFRTVTLPVVTPSIASGALIVFCMSIENFGVPTIIGNDYKVLAEQAYSEFVSEMGGNPSMAGALSMVLVIITLALTVLQKVFVERKSYSMSALRPPEILPLSKWKTRFAWLYCAGLVFVSLAPFLVVLVAAVTKTNGPVMYYGQFSLDNLAIALQTAPRPILNSFFLSTLATVIGMFFGMAVSYIVVRRRGWSGYQCGKSLCGVLDGSCEKPRDYVLSELSGEIMYMDEEYKVFVNNKGEIYMLFDRKNDKEEQYNLAASDEARETENALRAKIMKAIAENVIIPSTQVQTAKAITR